MPAPVSPLLVEVLGEARRAGFLGPGDLGAQLRHAQGFAEIARRLGAPQSSSANPRTIGGELGSGEPGVGPRALARGTSLQRPVLADLGSGGGLPGLVVACAWEGACVTLVDSSARRTEFLERARDTLGLQNRLQVVNARAEVCGREDGWRGTFDGVTARSFGRPAVVAECAAPLLKVGGWLLVSEPPPEEARAAGRWPESPLRQLGLVPGEEIRGEFGYQVLRQVEACPERFPRRVGVPAKKPLF